MQLDTEDIVCLEKLGFIVEPALPADKKSRFEQIVQNPFIHLEDIRGRYPFLGREIRPLS